MGGAFVAIADDARAAVANPAGLTHIPVVEFTASSGRPWAAAAAARRRFHVAAYYTKAEVDPLEPRADGPQLALQPSLWEAGVAAGVRPFRHLRLGVGVAYTHLRLEEEGRSPITGAHPVDGLVGREDGVTRVSFGALVDLMPAPASSSDLKLGLTVQPGVTWKVDRSGSVRPLEIRRPALGSLGLAWRANNSWSFSAQGDYVRFNEVVDALRRNVGELAGRDFNLPNVVEPRVGAEFAAPLRCGCGTVKLRGGVHYQSPGTLRYGGADPTLLGAFPVRSWRAMVTLGGSFFAEHFGNALRLDVDSRDLLDGPAMSFGVVWRF